MPSPILITGATGTLGQAFARICEGRGLSYRLLSRREMDIAIPASVDAAFDQYQPWAVINTAGYVRVDQAEADREACYRENTHGPATLAVACQARGTALLTFSSDLVFDGQQRAPYLESEPVAPINVYGKSKAEAEQRVLDVLPSALVVRASAFFGPWDRYNFVTNTLNALQAGRTVIVADDACVSPTYVPDLVHAALDLLIDGESGIWHLANVGEVTWAELARFAATQAGIDPRGIEGRPTVSFGYAAPRPLYSVLGSERGWVMPPLDDALNRYLDACEQLERARTYGA